MAEQIIFEIKQKQLTEDLTVFNELEYDYEKDYTKNERLRLVYASDNTWYALSFDQITAANTLKITTDQEINIRLNSGSEIFVASGVLIWNGSFSAIDIRNNSGYEATVNVELYE